MKPYMHQMYHALSRGSIDQLRLINQSSFTSAFRGQHAKPRLHVWECSIRTLGGHRQRVGALAWGSHLLSTGSRDRHILHHDIRAPEDYVTRLNGHRSEVCVRLHPPCPPFLHAVSWMLRPAWRSPVAGVLPWCRGWCVRCTGLQVQLCGCQQATTQPPACVHAC